MKELSIFVDESGDFGNYSKHSPYYIVSMVFHDQREDIKEQVNKIQYELNQMGYNNPVIHTEPLIRRENEYAQKVLPCDYRLFQVADLICTLELVAIKAETNELSKSEQLIFHSKRDLKKDFLKNLRNKAI